MELIPLDPRATFGAYRELVEDVAGVLWELDLATLRFTFASPQAASILGHAAERLVADASLWPASLHPDDRPRWLEACADCRRGGGTLDIDFRLLGADGAPRWVRAVGKATSRPGLAPVLRGLFLDIARRKQAEAEAERLMHEATATAAALRASEESYRLLADSVPDQVWTAQPDGKLDYVNGRVLEYFGRSFEAMIGEGWLDVLHPADVGRVVQRWQKSLGTGEGYQVEFRLRRADGEYRWHIGRALPQCDAEGRVVKWFGTNTDVEDERRAEAARDRALAEARAERQRLYEVFMQAPAAITVLEGAQHVFTVSNPRYQELTGNRELVGKPARQATPELEGQGFFELLDSVYASGLPYAADERPVRLDRDGDGTLEELFLDFVYQPLKDAQGHTFGVLAHAVEVTEKVHARDAIAAARAEAERANRAKSQFLAAMSHDLRTPLNAIGGYAELVSEGMYGPVTDAQRNAMTRIQGAARHLLALITDILSYAKIEAGSLQLELADLPVNATLAELAPLVELQISEKGLGFALERGPDDVRMRGDAERTTQILINLLTNAVKFTPAGTIGVRWEADERAVRIHVRDTGRGIPRERLEAIFEPFVQAGRTAEEQQQGVGLGLATSRELARAMGGELTAVSVPGEGSTFTLKLPRSA